MIRLQRREAPMSRFLFTALILLTGGMAFAQQAAKPEITVEQIINKAIDAAGGRAAMEKLTSYVSTGTIEMSAMGMTANNETYAKAPNKRLSVTSVEGFGEILQGYDGKVTWSKDPQGGVKEITGEMGEQSKRESTFNGLLHWKELYPTSEVVGKDKAAGHDCWLIKLKPVSGNAVQQCYDTESFLMTKAVNPGPNGSEIPVELSDYKDPGTGVKMPMTVKVNMPNIGEMVIRYKDIKGNAAIDDAKFSKPAE